MMIVGMREVLHKRNLAMREYGGDYAGLDLGEVLEGERFDD